MKMLLSGYAKVMSKPIEILLVEDNAGDVRLTREVMKEGGVESMLRVAMDGEEALRMLRKEGGHACLPMPDLIILDLNLPRMNGIEVLRAIKEDPSLRRIPVLVMTTSEAAEDVNAAYDLNANCYIAKPCDFTSYMDVIQVIKGFWLTVVTLPNVYR